MHGGHRVFERGAQLFVKLLARAHTGELDLDVFMRLQTRQQNQVSGEVHDFDRLTHVQDTDLAAVSDDRSLQHELGGFGYGHEEAAHLRVRDGDRTAARDLFLKYGDDATVRAKHVA